MSESDGADTDYAALFGLDETHTLELAEQTRSDGRHSSRDVRWFREHDAGSRLVARYRTWHTRASRAPYRSEIGWERFSVDGRLLDREVRHSTEAARRALN